VVNSSHSFRAIQYHNPQFFFHQFFFHQNTRVYSGLHNHEHAMLKFIQIQERRMKNLQQKIYIWRHEKLWIFTEKQP